MRGEPTNSVEELGSPISLEFSYYFFAKITYSSLLVVATEKNK